MALPFHIFLINLLAFISIFSSILQNSSVKQWYDGEGLLQTLLNIYGGAFLQK